MVRQYPGSGEIFEPSTVQDKVDITADTQISIPVILDLKERKLIWTDLSLTRDQLMIIPSRLIKRYDTSWEGFN